MNLQDRRPMALGEAVVEYLDGDLRVVKPGAFVRCAVTREQIPVEMRCAIGASTCRKPIPAATPFYSG